ncbi:MAG: class I SAM-dependent rRNA methyltransferase [Gammaproteobacteria bacterium]
MTDSPSPDFAVLRLKRNEDRRLRSGHAWIFSNEVDIAATPLKGLEAGQPVRIEAHSGKAIGTGYANPSALICARILSRDPERPFGPSILVHRLKVALALRERLFEVPCYRLVHGDGDGLPGLVIDRHGDVVVIQVSTAGMERMIQAIVDAVQKVINPVGIVLRNDGGFRDLEGLEHYTEVLGEVPDSVWIEENGARFAIDVAGGQKTGWFYDQRDNRRRAARHSRDARVLDVFSFAGGFGVLAAVNGAREAVCIDASESALHAVETNADANGVSDRVAVAHGDAFELLKAMREAGERFDVVMVDPPAFIKRKKDMKEGQNAYRRINQAAMQLLGRDGIIVSSSCSYHLRRDTLQTTLNGAARHLDRSLQILEHGYQGPDHPINAAIAETEYLKTITGRVLIP